MPRRLNPTLKAVSDAVLAVAAQRSVDDVLQQLVDHARELAGARYAALGTPDDEGGFSRFLVSGMPDELVSAMGPLPRTHGLLGAMLAATHPYRIDDIHHDPRFRGWWPAQHPDMHSFLGVPIVATDGVIGAFYLTDKTSGTGFDAADQELIEILATHAAIAITNARLYEQSRALTILSERNRLALDLHDAVSQKLFGLVLAAESAGTLVYRDPAAAARQLQRLTRLAREALDELRSLILELRPPDLDRDGLAETLRKHVDLQRRLHATRIEAEIEFDREAVPDPVRDQELLRIAQEALHNALRHAAAERIKLRLAPRDGWLVLEVSDDGIGFAPLDPALRATRLGLTSMRERAARLGAELVIDSAPGAGTTVRVAVARG